MVPPREHRDCLSAEQRAALERLVRDQEFRDWLLERRSQRYRAARQTAAVLASVAAVVTVVVAVVTRLL